MCVISLNTQTCLWSSGVWCQTLLGGLGALDLSICKILSYHRFIYDMNPFYNIVTFSVYSHQVALSVK